MFLEMSILFSQPEKCHTEDFNIQTKTRLPISATAEREVSNRSVHVLRTYRIAISATGEYTQYHGSITDAFNAIQQTISNINQVYERDLSIRFQLVPNNIQLIYFDPLSDPFTNGQIAQMANENQQLLDNVIGDSNYDLGMVFGTSGGGLALPASMGISGKKANAACGNAMPEGIGFDFDFVAHEIGHQLGAHHTHNNPCSRHVNTAFEPGSGSTIMSYAGICPPNLQLNVDPYFHAISIDEIRRFVLYGPSSSMGNIATTGNTIPQLLVNPGPFIVPKLTPFLLDAQATDPDGDSLTWCWEQFDLGISGTLDEPVGNAPVFRSYAPEPNSLRSFPKLTNLIFSLKAVGEQLPDYKRDMNFRVTVRDNHMGGGATNTGLTSVSIWEKAGPFKLLRPNDVQTWTGGSLQEIKWAVAGTDLPPINCKSVDIFLSTDGGRTFPIPLAEDIPNTGSAVVSMPRIFASKCRIRIKAHEGIFYDLSDHNFQLEPATSPTYTMHPYPVSQQVCQADTAYLNVIVDTIKGFRLPIGLELSGLPQGVSASFSKNPANGSDTVRLAIFPMDHFPVGNHKLQVKTLTFGGPSKSQEFELITYPTQGGKIEIKKPLAGARAVHTMPIFEWEATNTAQTFSLEISSHPAFPKNQTITYPHLDPAPFTLPSHLAANSIYYWRVREENHCRKGLVSETRAFQTFWQGCQTYFSTDIPKTIPILGSPDTSRSQLLIADSMIITDVNVKDLKGEHSWVSDLELALTHPSGKSVILFSTICGDSISDFHLNFDQESPSMTISCPPTNAGTYQPLEPLSDFYDQQAAGLWSLEVRDLVELDGGKLLSWGLELCARTTSKNSPDLLRNQILEVKRWNSTTITPKELTAATNNQGAAKLVFTLLDIPEHGHLSLKGDLLTVGDTFTQADIDQHRVQYHHHGQLERFDSFRFTLRNEGGGWLGEARFQIAIQGPLDIEEGKLAKTELFIYPNPARDYLFISLPKALNHDTELEIWDIRGKLLIGEKISALNKQTIKIDISELESGYYFLRLGIQDEHYSHKFIVN